MDQLGRQPTPIIIWTITQEVGRYCFTHER